MVKDIKSKMLQCIEQEEDVYDSLIKEYTYSQIGETFLQLIEEKLIVYQNKEYELTEEGIKVLKQFRKFESLEVLNNEKLDKNDCLSIDDIYIPKYRKGGFGEIKN